MELRFDDRAVLVTGASRGIGLACAAGFLDSGAKGVVITSRKEENLAEAAERLGAGDRLRAVVARADDPEDAARAVATSIEAYGSCDVLVNNAGTNPVAGNLADIELSAVRKTWAVNQEGPLLHAREAWRQWMAAAGGAVVNVASIAGMEPSPWLGAYNVSKAALLHMTRQLALEMAPRVRVNAVAPGLVRTRFASALYEGREEELAAAHPLRRIGRPEDIATAVLFLASDAASWITGQCIIVDGGATGATGAVGLA